ncbi:hypothetical protein BLA29_015085, partial [Euroglyphus maynei]
YGYPNHLAFCSTHFRHLNSETKLQLKTSGKFSQLGQQTMRLAPTWNKTRKQNKGKEKKRKEKPRHWLGRARVSIFIAHILY